MTGILLLAYGGPGSLEEVRPYLDQVRGGRPYSDDFLTEVTERYRFIGGSSPMPGITRSTADKLSAACGLPVYVGMLHWAPSIEKTIARMARDGVTTVLAICMAPHFSEASVGRYRRRVDAAAAEHDISFDLVEDWHLASPYLEGLADAVKRSCAGLAASSGYPHIVFSAHSLPKVALPSGDPYEAQLRETAVAVAGRLGVSEPGWTLAFQSVSGPAAEWLGPSVEQIVKERAELGEDHVVVCPFGFVADQVEILYDLDFALTQKAAAMGVTILRTPLPNDGPAVVDSLAALVERWAA